MERFFAILGRINSLLFLAALIGAATSVAWMTLETNRWRHRGSVEVAESDSGGQKPILLSFERLENISGSDTQMMRLTAQSAKFSSGGYGHEIRNIVFLRETDNVAKWLFKDHKNLILASVQLHEESSNSKDQPTKALYFEYVTLDTNNDGKLSSDDHSNIGLTKPDGTDFLELLHDLTRVFSFRMLDRQHLSIVYQKGTAVKHAKFSLDTMKVVADQEIVNVPSTL